jgi:hypothetical protein
VSKRKSVESHPGAAVVRDPRALRALAHPLRWSLIEVLIAEQTATATRCAALLGEPVNSCSFHLRMLEKYGYIERVAMKQGRDRPWRLIEQRVSWDPSGEDESVAADELNEMLIEREARRQRAFLRTRGDFPVAWRRAASAQGAYRWMTPKELTAVNAEIEAVFDRYLERHDPAVRPSDARLVRLVCVALPMASTQKS